MSERPPPDPPRLLHRLALPVGQPPPLPALERLVDAMMLIATTNRKAGECYRHAFRVAIAAAPATPVAAEGLQLERLMTAAMKRLEQHLAGLPNVPPEPPPEPDAAA